VKPFTVAEAVGTRPSFLMASPEKALADKVWTDKRFSGTRVGDFAPYLFDDLRIAPETLRTLDRKRFDDICQAYDSPKIRNLSRFLLRLRTGEADDE